MYNQSSFVLSYTSFFNEKHKPCVKMRKLLAYGNWKLWVFFLLPLLLLPLPLLWQEPASRCLYVLLIMGCSWLLELLPIPATALIPVVLFPFFGIMSTGEVSMFYMKSSIMLFIGGLMVAIAVEHSNLHRYGCLIWKTNNIRTLEGWV